MYLVDTSVWIDFLRKKNTHQVTFLNRIFQEKASFAISAIIYQEVLQGATTATDFKQLQEYLSTQQFIEPLDFLETYTKASKIYFDCRKQGITIRSTIDCLIAQLAIEHELSLLHNDNDFIRIQKIRPQLSLVS